MKAIELLETEAMRFRYLSSMKKHEAGQKIIAAKKLQAEADALAAEADEMQQSADALAAEAEALRCR